MREILFRGKRKDNGEWVYGNYCGAEYLTIEGMEYLIIEVPRSGSSAKVIPETVGQYTGLTDKNGTKIFEGDIVEVSTNHHYVGVAVERQGTFEVVFRGGCFMKKKINGTGMFHFIETDATRIIGNIYDHSELLKGGEG